ncbi:MAG: hypothetical protein M4579_004250 [Chaenotheca gracillima]|nr:MAG: hypothetical protein M4579_004250 [Chaenotheca gracillima]
MAPTRRYLRISKFSVLECRIYLDNPALANSWLLHPRAPVLPRIIARIKPLVLPKLREENDRIRSGKGKKNRAIKDVVVEDDYEVSIFFQDRKSTSHALLTKSKTFVEPKPKPGSKGSRHGPIEIGDDDQGADAQPSIVLREEDSEGEGGVALSDIPAAESSTSAGATGPDTSSTRRRKSKRKDSNTGKSGETGSARKRRRQQINPEPIEEDDDEDDMEDGPNSRNQEVVDDGGVDDKKKLGLNTSYDGFKIYGLTLCMVVHRRQSHQQQQAAAGSKEQRSAAGANDNSVGRAIMEGWISSSTGQPLGDAEVGVEDETEIAG